MKILIQGPGAIGRYVAARLARAGLDVTLLDHDAERAQRLCDEGIVLKQGKDSIRVRVPALATGRGPIAGADWSLLISCVKAHASEQALRDGVRYLEPGGLVLVLSNGLGNLEAAERNWSHDRCLAGTLVCGAVRCGRFGVRVHGEGPLRLGTRRECPVDAPARKGIAAIVELFATAGLAAEEECDIERVIWEKVAVNCAINPLGALFGLRNGELPDLPAFAAAVRAAQEVGVVARRRGIELPVHGWRERIEFVCQRTRSNRCSMLVDLEEGRRTEIDALCGSVVELALEHGLAAPVNETFAELVRSLQELRAAPAHESSNTLQSERELGKRVAAGPDPARLEL